MKLRYTPEAIADLQEVKQYIKDTLRNSKAADRIAKIILDGCAQLKMFPQSGASIKALTGQETDLRMLVCENYIALYRIDTDVISVARIISAKQDYMRVLFREDAVVQMRSDQRKNQH